MEVDIQRGVAAFAEGGFHGRRAAVGGPGVVDSIGGFLHVEGDVGGGVRRVEHKGLVAGQGLAQVGRVLWGLVEGGNKVEVGFDGSVLEGGGALLELGGAGGFVQGAVYLAQFGAGGRGAADALRDILVPGRSGAGGRVGGGPGMDEGSEEE